MEMGGNHKALEYLRKNHLKNDPGTPVDYKSAILQRYKNDLLKKIDIALEQENGSATTASQVPAQSSSTATKSPIETAPVEPFKAVEVDPQIPSLKTIASAPEKPNNKLVIPSGATAANPALGLFFASSKPNGKPGSV